MADKDVRLIIRAKNEASKEIKSISQAMRDLADETDEAGSSVKKNASIFGQLTSEIKKFNAQTAAFGAISRVAGIMEKAGESASKLRADVAGLKTELDKSKSSTDAAAKNTEALRANLTDLQRAFAEAKAKNDANRAAQDRSAESTKRLSAAKKELARANELSAKNSERETRIETAKGNIASAQAAQDANVAAYAASKEELAKLRKAVEDADKAVSDSEKSFRQSADTVLKLEAALAQAVGEVDRVEKAIAEMNTEAQEASAALGVMAGAEREMLAATQGLAPQIQKMATALAALNRYSTGGGAFADPKAAAAMRAQREEMEKTATAQKELQAIAQRLANEIRETGDPTGKLAAQLREVTGAAKAAKTEFAANQAALAKLQGSAKSTFAEFSKANGTLPSLTANYERNVASANRLAEAMQRYSTGAGGVTSAALAEKLRAQNQVVDEAAVRYLTLTQEVRRLMAAMQQGGTEKQAAELRQVSQAANQAEKELKEANIALRQMQSGVGNPFAGINSGGRESLSLFQRLRGEVLSLTASFVGFFGAIEGVKGVLATYQQIEAANNRLGAVFKQNSELVGNEIDWLRRQAGRLGIEFGNLAGEYGKYAIAAQAANISSEATRSTFLAVAEAGRVNKLSMDDMNGVFLALTQSLSKGTFQAEEVRGQLGERLPGAFNILADAIGVTTEELGDMMKKGEVLANQETLLKFAEELNKRFGSQLQDSLKSTTTNLGLFANNVSQAQLQFAKGGFIEAFNKALADLDKWFKSREGRDFFLSLGAAAGKFIDVLRIIPENLNTVLAIVRTLISIKLAQWFAGMAGSIVNAVQQARLWTQANTSLVGSSASLTGTLGALRAQVVATGAAFLTMGGNAAGAARGLTLAGTTATALRGIMAAATIGARALWTALGGWIGVIATGVSLLATSLLGDWLGGVNDVTSALDEHQRIMDNILSKYDEAKGSVKDWSAILKDMTLDQLDANVTNLESQFNSLKSSLTSGDVIPYKFWQDGIVDTAAQVNKLRDEFKNTGMSATEFRQKLEKIYAGTSSADAKAFIQDQLKIARQLEEVSRALDQGKDAANRKKTAVDGLRGTLSDVRSPLEQAAEASRDVAAAMGDGSKAADTFKESLDGIKGMIPELAEGLAKLKDEAKLEEFIKGLGMGPYTPEIQALIDRARGAINDKYSNYEADYTAQRGTPQGAQMAELVKATTILAEKMGLSAKDLLTAMSYETGGTLDPWKAGPTTQWGQHRGLIQWGEPQRQKYGVTADSSIEDQIKAVGKYLTDAGVKAGDGLLQIYAAINAGNAKKINASDANNGGAPGTVLDKVQGQMGGHEKRAEALLKTYGGIVKEGEEIVKKEEEANKKREEGRAATQKTLEDGKFELEQQDRKLAGKEREAAIEQAIREAKAKDPNIGDKELEQIRAQAGALYDKQNALTAEEQKKKEIADATNRVNELEEKRNGLLEQRKYYEEQGNTEGVQKTTAELQGVNAELLKAIDNAIKYQEAMGGTKADVAIQKLNNMKLAIANTNMEGQRFAMTATQMGQSISSSLENGIINMFDSFAQAVANGENAVDALWTAFRQFAANFLLEISKMILKQILFNSLQTIGKALGGGIFSFTSMHSGGVVGASGVGAGSRAISPAWFNNAVRYHSGGVAGLAPDEVPTVLKEGEEVLTETDARHRDNLKAMGGGGRGGSKIVNMFDSGSFLSEALNSEVGTEVILNHVRANPSAWRQAMNS